MSWTMPWMKSQSVPSWKTCPECGIRNADKASRCSGCSLDLKFLGYIMEFLTGAYPRIEFDPGILNPGEVCHLRTGIRVTGLRNNPCFEQESDTPKDVLVERPCSSSFNRLDTGFMMATNRRIIIIVGGIETYGIPWREIKHFDLDAKSVRIFHEGRHSGDICHVEDTRPLWWLYYSKKHLEPYADFLKSPDLNDATDDERMSILSVMSQMELALKKAQGETRLAKPRRSIVLLVMLLLIVVPPYGFRMLFRIGRLGALMETGLFLFGMCSIFSWMFLLLRLTRSLELF